VRHLQEVVVVYSGKGVRLMERKILAAMALLLALALCSASLFVTGCGCKEKAGEAEQAAEEKRPS